MTQRLVRCERLCKSASINAYEMGRPDFQGIQRRSDPLVLRHFGVGDAEFICNVLYEKESKISFTFSDLDLCNVPCKHFLEVSDYTPISLLVLQMPPNYNKVIKKKI